jgi:4'-phosphopantetheinyl transferase
MFRFQAGRWGKLRIMTPEISAPLDFSVSHSGPLSVVAISPYGRIGIDVERVRPIADAPAIANDVLGDRAVALLSDLSDGVRDRAFLKLWTAAEAVAKATGQGWAGHGSISTYASDSNLADTSCDSLPPAAPGREWTIASLDVGPDYIGSLVMEGPAGETRRDADLRPATLNS